MTDDIDEDVLPEAKPEAVNAEPGDLSYSSYEDYLANTDSPVSRSKWRREQAMAKRAEG